MIVDSKNFHLHRLVLKSLTLDNFEYCYLCPLLEQTGLYSGHVDVILTAQQLSQQRQYICRVKKKIEQSLTNTHEFIKNEYNIFFCVHLNIFDSEIDLISYETIVVRHYQYNVFSEIYLCQLLICLKHTFCEVIKLTIKTKKLEFSKENSFEQSIFICLTIILIYKIWKIDFWYPLISKLAFDSKELAIAKYFIQLIKLEYKMISMLINLFK